MPELMVMRLKNVELLPVDNTSPEIVFASNPHTLPLTTNESVQTYTNAGVIATDITDGYVDISIKKVM